MWGLYPAIQRLPADTWAYALASVTAKVMLWILPTILYVRAVLRRPVLHHLRLRSSLARGLRWGLAVSVLNGALAVAVRGIPDTPWAITRHTILSATLLTGLVEEIVFRGIVFRGLADRWGVGMAVPTSAALFTAIYLPGWWLLDGTIPLGIAAQVFVTGVVLALLTHWSRSLWAPIMAHSTNDFLAFVVFDL